MSVFIQAQGMKTVQGGGGSKNGKILSTWLFNDPKPIEHDSYFPLIEDFETSNATCIEDFSCVFETITSSIC